MKKATFTFLFLALLVSLSNFSCSDDCDKTMQTLFESRVRVTVNAYLEGVGPIVGAPLIITVQKTHCDGKKGELYKMDGQTNSSGYYETPGSWTFKFDNSLDFVTFRVEMGGDYANVREHERFYDYYAQYAFNGYISEDFVFQVR